MCFHRQQCKADRFTNMSKREILASYKSKELGQIADKTCTKKEGILSLDLLSKRKLMHD